MAPRRSQTEINAEARATDPNQRIVNLLVEAIHNMPVNPIEVTPRTSTFKDFKLVGPPEFTGTTEPIEAQAWITEMEKHFLVTNVSEDQKTVFATFFLKGEANFWWETNRIRAGVGIISWNRFKELFFGNYFPQSMQNRMEIRFLELKQGELTIAQYTAKFNELARFAPHQVDSEERKTRRFEEGLKPQIRRKLAVLQITTFQEILEKAIIAEKENEVMIKFYNDKRNLKEEKICKREINNEGNNSTNKRKWNDKNKKENGIGIKTCETCGKNHTGECLREKRVCYNCGQEGHFSSKCPSPRKIGCYNCHSTKHEAKNCPRKQAKRLLRRQKFHESLSLR